MKNLGWSKNFVLGQKFWDGANCLGENLRSGENFGFTQEADSP